MNNPRRKELRDLQIQLEEIKAAVNEIQEQEEEYRDNIPENLQCSQRYETSDEAIDNLCLVFDALEEAINYIEEAMA